MNYTVIKVAIALLIISSYSAHALERPKCDSSEVVAGVKRTIIKYGTNKPEWVFKLNLNVPYFRMKDVRFSVRSIQSKGPSRRGTDCEIRYKLEAPRDIRNANAVMATFKYTVFYGRGGNLNIELY